MRRVYGSDKLIKIKLNAKELTLKKINADTNWVDIYTTGFMLGESLDSIANLMLHPSIAEVLNNFNSSVFNVNRNNSKIAYIQQVITDARGQKYSNDINLLSNLLDRIKDAEELRILGKMLKINQGISTNTIEQFNYIKAIESFIESAYNDELKTLMNKVDRFERVGREMDNQMNEMGMIFPETSEVYDNLFFSITNTLTNNYGFTKEQVDDFIQNKSNYRNITFINLWNRFSLLKFIEDRNYADDWINKYEKVKRHFNILDVIDKVPHFREMFKVLDINTKILNTLSTRNHLENIILNSTIPNGDPRRKLSTDDIRKIKSAIDDHIINSWLIDKDLVISIAPHALDNVVEYQTSISSIEQIQQFRRYVESYVIPLLKEKLPNNKFIQQLIFGVKNDTPFYKLPFNMVQIDNTAKTKLTYEETLRDFNKLNNIKIDGIDMNLVDVFYLYNLIVNKDKFGPNSLTRIFEDVLASPGNEKLLVYDFNKWLDEQDPMLLAKTFTYPEIEGEDKEYYSDLDSSIGFKNEPTESDIEESQIESASDAQISNAKDLTPPITQELDQHVKNDDKNKATQIIEPNSQLSSFAERPFKLYIEDNNGEIVYDFRLPIAAHDISAGTLMLLDRTYPTFKTVEGAYQATKLQYQNELSESEMDDLIIKLANASGLEARELGQSIQITDIEDWNEDSPMILKELIKVSFIQNPKFIDKLLLTNDDILISKFNNDPLEAKYLNLLMEVRDELKPSHKPQAQQLDLFTNYYDTKPSVRAELIEKIKAADMKGLHIVYDSDLVNDDSTTRNAKGFVRNGEIYINVDRATNDTVIHEFGHLYLADAKLRNPNEYYELLSEVRKTNIWQRMRSMIEYQNKRGSDFDEEVLATIISNYYKDNSENPDSPFSENAYFAVKALDLVSPEFKEFLSSDTIPQLSDALITNYKDQQKLATVKNQLTKDNIIKEDCK